MRSAQVAKAGCLLPRSTRRRNKHALQKRLMNVYIRHRRQDVDMMVLYINGWLPGRGYQRSFTDTAGMALGEKTARAGILKS